MRGTLIGTDYLYQGDDVKILEINTNSAILSNGVQYLDLDPLFQRINDGIITEFHFIYSEAMTIGRDGDSTVFLDALQEKCDDLAITFVKHQVAGDAVTIPNIEDADTKFILRQAYDASAIVDSLYCNDKMEFLNLLSGSDDIPESYYSSSDGFYTNTIDLDTTVGAGEPNGIIKARYPAYNLKKYPSVKRYGSESDLTDDINNLETEDYIIQEYVSDEKNFIDDKKGIVNYGYYSGRVPVMDLRIVDSSRSDYSRNAFRYSFDDPFNIDRSTTQSLWRASLGIQYKF